MRYLASFILVLFFLYSSARHAEVLALISAPECGQLQTSAPKIPDGAAATQRAMLSAIEKVKAYSKEVNDFLDCNEGQRYDIFENLTQAQQVRWAAEFNALIDKLVALEEALNEQIAIFNK